MLGISKLLLFDLRSYLSFLVVARLFRIFITLMKILLHYLKPHKWLVILVLFLAAINIGFL